MRVLCLNNIGQTKIQSKVRQLIHGNALNHFVGHYVKILKYFKDVSLNASNIY